MTQSPTPEQIKDLVDRAKTHEFGTGFLLNGSLDAVAATFGVHAFVVDGARDLFTTPAVATEQPIVVNA